MQFDHFDGLSLIEDIRYVLEGMNHDKETVAVQVLAQVDVAQLPVAGQGRVAQVAFQSEVQDFELQALTLLRQPHTENRSRGSRPPTHSQ